MPGENRAPRSFVAAGSGEAREGGLTYEGRIIRRGDQSPEAMREKARFVLGAMELRMAALGFGGQISRHRIEGCGNRQNHFGFRKIPAPTLHAPDIQERVLKVGKISPRALEGRQLVLLDFRSPRQGSLPRVDMCIGEPVALNDTIMVFAFAPIVGLLLGLSSITVPRTTLFLSVVLYIVVPVVAAQLWRRSLLSIGGDPALAAMLRRLQPVSLVALLAALVLVARCRRGGMNHGQTWFSMRAPQSCRDKSPRHASAS